MKELCKGSINVIDVHFKNFYDLDDIKYCEYNSIDYEIKQIIRENFHIWLRFKDKDGDERFYLVIEINKKAFIDLIKKLQEVVK